MSNSLKDALIKAGVVSKEKLDREKESDRREKIQSKGPLQHGIHAHHIRTDCDHCKKNSPDIEFYEHTNRSILAKWLCIPCADKACIKDDCRQSAQSSYSKSGIFRREYGATKKMAPTSPGVVPPKAPATPPKSAQAADAKPVSKPQTPRPKIQPKAWVKKQG
ncbi:MAG: hypothetical protein SGI74_11880 [Oligoflexia bacterium]|nr:hypothetical protein [Oligoflexia bacterium]